MFICFHFLYWSVSIIFQFWKANLYIFLRPTENAGAIFDSRWWSSEFFTITICYLKKYFLLNVRKVNGRLSRLRGMLFWAWTVGPKKNSVNDLWKVFNTVKCSDVSLCGPPNKISRHRTFKIKCLQMSSFSYCKKYLNPACAKHVTFCFWINKLTSLNQREIHIIQ